MHKLRTVIAGLVTVLILAQGVALAKAKNYCISGFPNAAYIQVGQGFKIPAPGKCKAFNGFNAEGNLPTTGLGCTSSDGTNLSFTLTTTSEVGTFAEIDAISLSLPSQTGSVVGQVLESNSTATFAGSSIAGAACSTSTIPAVTEKGAASTRPPTNGGEAQ